MQHGPIRDFFTVSASALETQTLCAVINTEVRAFFSSQETSAIEIKLFNIMYRKVSIRGRLLFSITEFQSYCPSKQNYCRLRISHVAYSCYSVDWLSDWYLMSHATNVHSEDRQCMQYNDKNERKKRYMYSKRQRGKWLFMHLRVTFGRQAIPTEQGSSNRVLFTVSNAERIYLF